MPNANKIGDNIRIKYNLYENHTLISEDLNENVEINNDYRGEIGFDDMLEMICITVIIFADNLYHSENTQEDLVIGKIRKTICYCP
jgi:hypothetical protein